MKLKQFVLTASNIEEILRLVQETQSVWYMNGLRYLPGDEVRLSAGDRIEVEERNVVDMIAGLATEADPEEVIAVRQDPYIVVSCPSPTHRRVNDVMIVDPTCGVCMGLGIARVHREGVPVIHRRGNEWVRGDDVISRLGDLA